MQNHDEGCLEERKKFADSGQDLNHTCHCLPKKISVHKHDCKVFVEFCGKLAGYNPYNKEKIAEIKVLIDKEPKFL